MILSKEFLVGENIERGACIQAPLIFISNETLIKRCGFLINK